MFGDTSQRTSRVSKPAIVVLVAFIVAIISSIGIVTQSAKYNKIVMSSSTPIGSSMTFGRSNATMELADIYTDKNSDVLIARLSTQPGDSAKLPYRGSDYKVFLSSKALDGYEEATVILGKMSTDGDMFLVIPKPIDTVYSVFIMNTKYLETVRTDKEDDESKQTYQFIEDENAPSDAQMKASISKALSSYQYRPDDKSSASYEIDDDYSDVISFRVTTKPAFKTEEFMPKKIDASLVNDKNEFDFRLFFDKVFKESVINNLSAEYKQLKTQHSRLDETRKELAERISINPGDSDAIRSLESIRSQQEEIEYEQDDIAKKIENYTKLTYNEDLFTNLQTKATIVETKKFKK